MELPCLRSIESLASSLAECCQRGVSVEGVCCTSPFPGREFIPIQIPVMNLHEYDAKPTYNRLFLV